MVMARTTGGLFLLGGLLGFVVTTQMPAGPGNLMVVYGAAVASILFGIVLLIWGELLPPRYHQGLVGIATILISIAIYQSTSAIAALSLASFYVFIACDASFFFTWLRSILQSGFAVVCCIVVIVIRGDLPWWCAVVPAGATVAVGAAVSVLGRLASDADIDVLTGLLNRRGFDRALNAEIGKASRSGLQPALVLVNLDRFSSINEQHGYRAGDVVLQNTAETWRNLIGPRHRLARYGGDEFALLLPELSELEAMEMTEKLREVSSTGCSAGVTSWQPGESASFLVSRADVGLYRAKQAGRNRTVLESSRRPPLALELLEAIARETLDVHYQPIVSLQDGGTTVGIEALVRWQSETQPGVTPEEVIRVAEEHDLITKLDQLVLHRACHDAAVLQAGAPDRQLVLSVNVSGLELIEADYITRVDEVLRATGWLAHQLVLEVTESVLDVDTPAAIDSMRALRARGIRIAIDDFGTGYSSLSRLKTVPADFLKLDHSFVTAITPDASAPPLLEVIALLSVALGLPVIAEGVETPHQAEVLTELGYLLAQGFHYGKPQSADDIALSLRTNLASSA
ncbi:bifunctional diguanylate cyclase/phosphodiesterase [Antrihabitans cavernicola]|uniref:Bifunctional diguanylate cyclase/phosphodiesterase n=1 Tax=Antrihabitans cavernicola TaxID=2495913 RepID=A0A5A7S5U0_9NOCA|nr:bifunctional diguanylate cyclase/phosphodiesterase [Spelaeibacter cavernicola]